MPYGKGILIRELTSGGGACAGQRVKLAAQSALHSDRAATCLSILQRSYADADVVCLQEASGALGRRLCDEMPRFAVVEPSCVDT